MKEATSLPSQISVPTVCDALTLRTFCDYLAILFSESVRRPSHEFMKRFAQAVIDGRSNLNFVRLDIKNFYPSVNHQFLLDMLAKGGMAKHETELVKAAIETVMGKPQLGQGNTIGVPQGLSISKILGYSSLRLMVSQSRIFPA